MSANQPRESGTDLIRRAGQGDEEALTALQDWFKQTISLQIRPHSGARSVFNLAAEAERSAWEQFRYDLNNHSEKLQGGSDALGNYIGDLIAEKTALVEQEFQTFEKHRAGWIAALRGALEADLIPSARPRKGLLAKLEDSVCLQMWRDRKGLPRDTGAIAARVQQLARETTATANLIVRHLQGDESAFSELIARFENYVRPILRRLWSRAEDQEDLLQEVWLKLSRAKLDPGRAGTFKGLLRTIASNAVYEHIKKNMPYILEADIGGGKEGRKDFDSLLPPVEQFPILHYTLFLSKAFNGLSPPHQALAFGFKDRLGYTPREIDKKYSQEPLRSLAQTFLDLYPKDEISRPSLIDICRPLLEQMSLPLDKVLLDVNARKAHVGMLHLICGETRLAEYAPAGQLTRKIMAWSWSVRRRLARELGIPLPGFRTRRRRKKAR